MAGVVVEQSERDLVERGLYRADLGQDVDAVAVVFDHSLHSTDLALDATEAVAEGVLGCGVAAGLGDGRAGHWGLLRGVDEERLAYPQGVWYSPLAHTPLPYQFLRMTDTIQTREYTVHGMTCAHCVRSVREEVSEIPRASAVDVDLASGRLTVTGICVEDDAVRSAVAEAGYEVAE
jgi:copper chaperone CopZ